MFAFRRLDRWRRRYDGIADPAGLARTLDGTVGVVDHGLFVGMAGRVLIGDTHGKVRVIP